MNTPDAINEWYCNQFHTKKTFEPIDNKPACMQNGPNVIICVSLYEQETYNVFTG